MAVSSQSFLFMGTLSSFCVRHGVQQYPVQTYSDTHPFNVWPKNPEGATLVVLPSELEYEPNLIVGLVAVEPPPLAETARLTIALTKDGGVTVSSNIPSARKNSSV